MSSIRVAIGGFRDLDCSVGPTIKGATLPVKVTQDFFVVGGPVQPDRSCYIRRAADEALLETIAAERFACVLAPRASGKSSLMGRALRRLRADGQHAAVIDLAQIGSRAGNVDSTRWHYSIAYRICRELRLKVNLQSWWQERKLLLNEQKLVEFFWDIVLANTTVPVTIFFDEAERVIDLPFSAELFAALHASYMRRVSEPEFGRLNFAVFGACTPEQLCPDPSVSPFVSASAIELEDFTLEQCYGLAPGFDQPAAVVRPLIDRIYVWTHGQPYLTQKLARGIARRGSRPADVDAVVHELFLGGENRREEPYLAHMRATLQDGSARARQALAMLGRLGRGGELILDPGSAAQRLLRLGGFVSSDENGMLRFRNRIVEQACDSGWVRAGAPGLWRRPPAVAAVGTACAVLAAFWYFRVLPGPYLDTFALVNTDYAVAEQAHDRLRRLPGFGRRADSLLADFMVRRSEEAESVDEARAADAALRRLPNREEQADRLMASFWLRRAEAAAHRGERDTALLNALAAIDAGSMQATKLAGNLIDGDYALLERTVDFDRALVDFAVDFERGRIAAVDESARLHHLPIAAQGEARPIPPQPTALAHVGVTRDLFVDEPGRAGRFQLSLTVDHPRTSDLLVRLRAPSGAAAELGLPGRDSSLEQFVFTASAENGLLRLAEESMTGQWELTVFDRLSDETGRLMSWDLRFPGVPQVWSDDPIDGLALPDPVRTGQVRIALARSGRTAVAIPSGIDARGAATVWDLGTGEPVTDLPMVDRAEQAHFVAADSLLLVGPVRAGLWRIASPEPVAEIVAASRFAEPAVAASADGEFFAMAENAGDRVRIGVYRVEDGRAVAQFETEDVRDFVLAAGASYVVAIDGTRRGRLIDPSNGETISAFFHLRELERVFAAPGRVVAVDRAGDIVSWPVVPGRRTLAPSDSVFLGATADPASIEVASNGEVVSFIGENGLATVSRLGDGYRRAVYGHEGAPLGTRFAPNADRFVSAAGSTLRFWRLPQLLPSAEAFGSVSALAMDAGGELAVIGHRNGQVQVLMDLHRSVDRAVRPPGDYFGHRGVVTSVALGAAGELAASGGSDGVVRVWNVQAAAPSPFLLRHPAGPIGALAFSPDGRWLASAGPGSARIFELETGALVSEIEVDGTALSLAFAPDSRTIAVGDSGGNIHLLAPDGRQGRFTIRGRSAITALGFADTPDVLASGSRDGDLIVWNTLEAGAMEGAYEFSAPIRWIRFAPGQESLRLQSGSWLYELDRRSTPGTVTASALLPARLRSAPAIATTGPGRLRVLANDGGGRLILDELELNAAGMAQAAAEAGETGPPVPNPIVDMALRRDWRAALGVEIDPESGLPIRSIR